MPTLATGLSAAAAAFGINILWDGTYASSSFTGFKAVNIYASTTNLGSSTTTNLTNNLVGTMTVDQASNKITIGLTLLRSVLNLTGSAVYTTPMYFYYTTLNVNNEVYKSNGVATYTRINSSGISPTQANKIDLEAGTISIENLVAGNGQFQEYLRVGTAGAARLELGANSVITTNAGVVPGLAIYNSANQAVLSAPLSGGLTIKGTINASEITGSSFSNLNASGTGTIIPSAGTTFEQITFKTNNSTTGIIASGTTAQGDAGIQINSTSSTSAGFAATANAAALFSGVVNGALQGLVISSGGVGAFSSYFTGLSNPNPNILGFRNIWSDNYLPDPTNFSNGDIVLVYS